MSYFNYTQIVKRDDKEYLYDPSTAAQRVRALEEMQGTHNAIFQMLSKSDYPANEEYCRAVAANGGRGLVRCIIATTSSLIPEGAPAFWVKQQKDLALKGIPDELQTRADELCLELSRNAEGVPIQPEDETYDPERGIVLDVEAVTARIEQGCSLPISDETRALAKEITSAILELRRLRGKRVNIREICQRKIGDPVQGGYPEISDLEMILAASVRLLPTDAEMRARIDEARARPAIQTIPTYTTAE